MAGLSRPPPFFLAAGEGQIAAEARCSRATRVEACPGCTRAARRVPARPHLPPRKARNSISATHDAEDAIAEEFQALVVGAAPGLVGGLLGALAAAGRDALGMHEGDAQQLGILEGVVQRCHQVAQIRLVSRRPSSLPPLVIPPTAETQSMKFRVAASGAR